jgi:amino acid transporter
MGTALAIPLINSDGYVFVFRLAGEMILFSSCLYVLSNFALRKRRPDLDRPYRAYGHPALPAIALIINHALLISFLAIEPVSGAIMAAFIAICIPVGIHPQRQRRRASLGKA